MRSTEAKRMQLQATIDGTASGMHLVQRGMTPGKTRAKTTARLAKRGVAKPKRGMRLFRQLPPVSVSRELTRRLKEGQRVLEEPVVPVPAEPWSEQPAVVLDGAYGTPPIADTPNGTPMKNVTPDPQIESGES
jgi:hypothetical protein